MARTVQGGVDLATSTLQAVKPSMDCLIHGALTDATRTRRRWVLAARALHGGLGPKVNHSCDPNCGVRLNDGHAFDFVARRTAIGDGQEVTVINYAMRNFTIDHFPYGVALCGAARCRGSITGWKDLPAARKAEYGELSRTLPAHDEQRPSGRPPAAVSTRASDVVHLSTGAGGATVSDQQLPAAASAPPRSVRRLRSPLSRPRQQSYAREKSNQRR